ncbi:uncharacterized protein RJT21DRAFT_123480 [Scheffersomyces amazonensis]|uniref:uncharacterized protein n=1 Tax=Scheffersomyces amazonensis TaxID=1078765 RepID=UPI00315C5424
MDSSQINLSELPQYSQWKITGYVQVVWFILILIGALATYIPNFTVVRTNFRVFLVSFTLYNIFKIAGGITSIILFHNKTFSTNVYIATYVFDSISLGSLIKCLTPFIQIMINDGFQTPQYFDRNSPLTSKDKEKLAKKNRIFKLLTVVIVVAIILSIIAATQIDFSTATPNSTSNTLFKVSSILFLACVILCTVSLIHILTINAYYIKFAILILICVPLLIVRVIYSIISSFHGIDYTSPYLLVFGDYRYYAFMVLLCEGLVAPLYLVTMNYFIYKLKQVNPPTYDASDVERADSEVHFTKDNY